MEPSIGEMTDELTDRLQYSFKDGKDIPDSVIRDMWLILQAYYAKNGLTKES